MNRGALPRPGTAHRHARGGGPPGRRGSRTVAGLAVAGLAVLGTVTGGLPAVALDPVTDGVPGPDGLVARVERVARGSGALEVTVTLANRGDDTVYTSSLSTPFLPQGVQVGVKALDPTTLRTGSLRTGSGGCECGQLPGSLGAGEAASVVLRVDDPGGAVVDILFDTLPPVRGVRVEGAPPVTAAGEQFLPRKLEVLRRVTKDGARASGSQRVDLDTDVLFAFGSATLSGKAGKTIDAAVEVLRAQPKRRLAVYGHTDGVGSDAANLTLSRKRAGAVRAALASRLGSGWTFEVKGFGETRPIAPEKTESGADHPAGRALNRRVELRLLG